MKAQTRCGSYALLFVLSLIGSSFAYSNNAFATSDYDNVLNLTTDVTFQAQNDEVCNNQSINGHLFAEFMYSDKITEQISNDYLYANTRFLTNIQGQNYGNINNTFLIGYGNNLTLNWEFALTGNAVVTSANTITVGCKEKYDFWGATGEPELYLVSSGYNDFATVSYKSPDPDNKGWSLVYFSGDPNYPTGYAGTLIPDTFNNIPDLTEQISIGYEVTDKHMKLWDTTARPPLDPSTMPCYWFIGINDPTHGPITFEDKITDCSTVIEWDFSTYTDYTVVHSILYDKDNDGAITYEEEIARMQITLNLDGSTYNGGAGYNWMHDSRDPVDCSGAGNFMLIVKCEFDNRLNFGLINPSLITVRNLFNSLMVPSDPQCSLVLNNVNLPGNTSFQLTNLVPTACEKSAQFRQMIPLITVALNGVMAFSLLYLIVRIINTLTNRRQNDLFVDLQDRGK